MRRFDPRHGKLQRRLGPLGHQSDQVADGQVLVVRHYPVGAVDVEAEQVLQPVIAVQPAAALTQLD